MDLLKMAAVGTVLIFMMGMSEGALATRTVRATELQSLSLSDILAGKMGDLVVEFRRGDQLPVTLQAEGDLLETAQAIAGTVGVKRDFWVGVFNNMVQISYDGKLYRQIPDALSGSLEIGANSAEPGGAASAIAVAFKAYVK